MYQFRKQRLAVAVHASVLAAGVALMSAPAHAGFEEVTTDNPFDAITSGTSMPSLVLQDFDSDDDLDAVVFHASDEDVSPFDGYDISFYENTGTAAEPEFTQITDNYGYGGGLGENFDENPFAHSWSYASYGHPVTSGDLDGDGDADFIGGTNTRSIQLWFGVTESDAYGVATSLPNGYHNRYTNPDYTPYYWSDSPFYGQDLVPNILENGGYGAAVPLDLDNDDDMDLVVVDNSFIRVYQNNGVIDDVVQLSELTDGNHPFYAGAAGNANLGTSEGVVQLMGAAYYGAPLAAGDVDNDGDIDVVMGVRSGPANMRLFLNTGTATVPVFEEKTDATLNVATSLFAAPVMADIDNDLDDDLVVAEQQASGNASYRLFLNDGEQPPASTDASEDESDSSSGGALGALLAALSLVAIRRRKR